MQIFPKECAARANVNARALLNYLQEHEQKLGLNDAVVFYNFPLFREDEKLLVSDLVLASPYHGVVLFSTIGNSLLEGEAEISDRLEGAFSQVFSRLVKYPRLRAGRARLSFPMDAFVWAQEGRATESVKVGLSAIQDYFTETRTDEPWSVETFYELVSVLDGSKALIKPKERKTVTCGWT